jgi:LysM domain
MSAMGAAELPEVPAALPQDSPRNRAAVRWTGAAELTLAARPERLPVLAARPELLPAPAAPAERLPVLAARPELLPVPAAPAELLPVPAARPERLPVPATRPERLPVPATRPEPPHGLAPQPRLAPDQAARDQAARDQAARDQAARVPLRLTRRGRVVVAVATVLLLAVLSLVIAASAQATSHPAPSGAAQRNLAQVTVRPGQSLWSVAENADPDADTRAVVQQIIELNGLTGNVVFAGQRLWVPRG